MERTTSLNNREIQPLSLKQLERIAGLYKYERPELPEYKPNLFEKIMNKLGWYRKTTVYLLSEKHLLNWANVFKYKKLGGIR